MWKYVERACLLLGTLFAFGCFYVEWAPHAGWWLPTPSVSAPAAAAEADAAPGMHVSMLTWGLLGFYLLGVALLITGFGMMFTRHYADKAGGKDKHALTGAPLSQAQIAFNLEMRTFVHSKLKAVEQGYAGAIHGTVNRYEGSPNKVMTEPQWRTLRELFCDTVGDFRARYDGLHARFNVPPDKIDSVSGQAAICEFLNAYGAIRQRVQWLLDATSLKLLAGQFNEAKNAESNALTALQDLKASPFATGLANANENCLR